MSGPGGTPVKGQQRRFSRKADVSPGMRHLVAACASVDRTQPAGQKWSASAWRDSAYSSPPELPLSLSGTPLRIECSRLDRNRNISGCVYILLQSVITDGCGAGWPTSQAVAVRHISRSSMYSPRGLCEALGTCTFPSPTPPTTPAKCIRYVLTRSPSFTTTPSPQQVPIRVS